MRLLTLFLMLSVFILNLSGCVGIQGRKPLGPQHLEPSAIIRFSDVPVPVGFKLISDRIHEHKCQLLKIGGTEDHIHLLVDMHPSTCVSNLVKSIKGFSSYSISNKIRPGSFFKWQGGYGAMTVSQNDISILSKYIANQKTHHSQKSIDSRWEIGGV